LERIFSSVWRKEDCFSYAYIHLPERLIGFLKLKQDDQGQGISEVQLIVVKIQKLDQPVLKSSPVGKILPTSHLAGSIFTGMEIV
jgi:hypothetical protein